MVNTVVAFSEYLSTLTFGIFEKFQSLKETVRANNELAKGNTEKIKIGKVYVATLSKGDEIHYIMADGSKKFGVIGEIKDGAKTLHIILDKQFVEAGKEADRYVSFDKIVVPAGFTVETDEIA